MSQRLAQVAPLRAMGGQDYPQFGDRVHAGGTNVWTETHHGNGADDCLMDDDRLGQLNEPRRIATSQNPATRVKAGRRGMGHDEGERSEDPEQGPVRLNAPAPAKEDRGRRLGVGLRQQPRQPG